MKKQELKNLSIGDLVEPMRNKEYTDALCSVIDIQGDLVSAMVIPKLSQRGNDPIILTHNYKSWKVIEETEEECSSNDISEVEVEEEVIIEPGRGPIDEEECCGECCHCKDPEPDYIGIDTSSIAMAKDVINVSSKKKKTVFDRLVSYLLKKGA